MTGQWRERRRNNMAGMKVKGRHTGTEPYPVDSATYVRTRVSSGACTRGATVDVMR